MGGKGRFCVDFFTLVAFAPSMLCQGFFYTLYSIMRSGGEGRGLLDLGLEGGSRARVSSFFVGVRCVLSTAHRLEVAELKNCF